MVSQLYTCWLRQQVAVVAQEPTLVNGSVEDNIPYALPRDDAMINSLKVFLSFEDITL